MQKENRGMDLVKEVILRINPALAEMQLALLAAKAGSRSGAQREVMQRGLKLLIMLKAMNLLEIPRLPGIELFEALQRKMRAPEFDVTRIVMQKCIASEPGIEPSEAEFSLAQNFLAELQSVYIETLLGPADA